MKLFIGNLAPAVTAEELQAAASQFGEVKEVDLPLDEAEQPKGFAFVQMGSKADGQAALEGLNGKELQGQALKVSEARIDRKQLRNKGRGGAGFGGPGQRGQQAHQGKGGSQSKGGFSIGKSSGHKV